ncbi:LysR substrate-binding domain-containing protein, partial [Pseudomonas aeruginosa]|uniref:LysR substrate-binding domain-containing protein n=1 Tax=Pseudomonas aeruginosa TaxID=287 RepID=UPI00399FCE98
GAPTTLSAPPPPPPPRGAPPPPGWGTLRGPFPPPRGYMAENHRPHDLRFNQGTDAYTMEAIATLVFSGTYIGYLPTHYAATWVAEGRMRAIRPRQLAYDSEFHCITRQGHEERPTLTLFLRSLFEAQKQLGVQAPANTNGIARQL